MATRRQFSREFKLEAVRLVKERGVSVVQAARDLGLHENVLRKWVSTPIFAKQCCTTRTRSVQLSLG